MSTCPHLVPFPDPEEAPTCFLLLLGPVLLARACRVWWLLVGQGGRLGQHHSLGTLETDPHPALVSKAGWSGALTQCSVQAAGIPSGVTGARPPSGPASPGLHHACRTSLGQAAIRGKHPICFLDFSCVSEGPVASWVA